MSKVIIDKFALPAARAFGGVVSEITPALKPHIEFPTAVFARHIHVSNPTLKASLPLVIPHTEYTEDHNNPWALTKCIPVHYTNSDTTDAKHSARLEYLTTHVNIQDTDDAWEEVFSLLDLLDVTKISSTAQLEIIAEALERSDDTKIIETLDRLVDFGLDINSQDGGGNSAIYLASTASSNSVVRHLTEKLHADPELTAITGDTAYTVAAHRLLGDEDEAISIIKKLVEVHTPSLPTLQTIHDFILSAGIEEGELKGIEIMGEAFWNLCDGSDAAFA